MRRLFVLLALPLAACAGDLKDIGREPSMTPVGTGLYTDVAPVATAVYMPNQHPSRFSIWDGNPSNIFSDPRAAKIGDVITVHIGINDSASFGNSTDRAMNSEIKGGLNYQLQQATSQTQWYPQVDTTSSSSTQGQGTIDRSEKIQLSVGAVVTDVLPNGNLVISGSQEVRVNYELRVLNIAGIVRPRDISKDNTVAYDKIAEARISYGGRGRIMEVQQPAVGQQIWDRFKPL
ncbi:MAG TPA: flagellar basal body L-ring protein FlgH [Methylovirgula sp.]|nr:flagellar basal body L-ring protein FlgH [Methylovirgula sp.]